MPEGYRNVKLGMERCERNASLEMPECCRKARLGEKSVCCLSVKVLHALSRASLCVCVCVCARARARA